MEKSEHTFSITELSLPGVFMVRPQKHADNRGDSYVPYDEEAFRSLGLSTSFVQDYTSFSKQGVIRGLHFQREPHVQDKLVRCSSGEIFDVVADCSTTSPTFGKHVAATLRADEGAMVFVPGKYAHGFCVLSQEGARVEYKLSDHFHPERASGVRYDDPTLRIPWPILEPILSEKDTQWPLLGAKDTE